MPNPTITAQDVATGKVTMWRGARREGSVSGPAYFASSEVFAKTYGPVTAFRLNLKKPLFVSGAAEWWPFANSAYNPTEKVIEELASRGNYDSVVADVGTVWAVFVLNAKKSAKLVKAPSSKTQESMAGASAGLLEEIRALLEAATQPTVEPKVVDGCEIPP